MQPVDQRLSVVSFMNDHTVSDLLPRRLVVLVLQVPLTVGLGGESKIAHFTLKGLLTRVPTHMPGQGAFVVAVVLAGADVASVGWLV